MKGFSNRWNDFPDYILGITREIWEDRGVATLHDYYSSDIPVRTPMGVARGNQGVIAATMATLHEFPDRELFGEDVIWSGDDATGYLSSHRIISTGTHRGDGWFGPATGRRFQIRVIADCAARADTIFDEWLVRDNGGLIRQLGGNPQDFARSLIAREGGPQKASRPLTPELDMQGDYLGRGNDNPWGQRYAETLTRIMRGDLAHVIHGYDRAVLAEHAGGRSLLSARAVADSWLGLRSSFPSATFAIHHVIGMDGPMMPPRAAIRWSLTGRHDGWGMFGAPTGAAVHVMGMAHAEYGPFGPDGIGLRREFALFDEIAIWKQILLHTGDL
ncbi:ester cyclase [Paracoccus sp. WLY502]|uniref:nuclear transport factor 2 family protein n=1 Tax=Paracoccus yibinensis TaxID=3068891 RepID=UPI00279676A0|nr:ester cyclase [Paracoccus sp. WLY502]MDQ1902137.1 ester cyclase [Paracoccus sp. WLY502]